MRRIIIDGNNALFRFGWVHQRLTDSNGNQTGALYGLLRLMLRLKKIYPDGQFVIAWDGAGETWRTRLSPLYKANRKSKVPTPESIAIRGQSGLIQDVTSMFGVPNVSYHGIEADDLIGMLTLHDYCVGSPPVIYSSDMDFLQLLNVAIVIRDVDKKIKLAPETERSVLARFGCPVDQLLKVRALAGDKTDGLINVVRGIGPKKAANLIAAGLDPSKPQTPVDVPEAFRTNWDKAHTNYQLMRIVRTPTDGCLTAVEKIALGELLHSVMKRLTTPQRCEYQDFVGVLAHHGMLDALAERHALWHLQY